MLEKLLHTEGIEIVLRDMAQSTKKLQGGKFQLQYFAAHLAEGTSIVKFEVREEIEVGEKTVARIYDIVEQSRKGLTHYELKNWSGWGSWSSTSFQRQFLKDLAAMAEGKRIKWVFSGHKMSRGELKRKILDALREQSFMVEITTLIEQPSVRQALSDALGTDILEATDLYTALKEDKVFNLIFDITE